MINKLIIGIDETTDIDSLLSDGVEQFYFGYIPNSYIDKYATQTSLNRRYRLKEQFSNLELCYDVIEKIKAKNATIYLALNSFTSNEIMSEYSKEIYELFCEKVDGIIVANVSMAMMLKTLNYDKMVMSNLFGVYSTDAVEFLVHQFKPMKIILPRDISLENIKKIVTTFPHTDFECFLYGDNCRYSESFCFSEHGYDSVGFGSLCSYAQEQKILLKTTTPAYKQIVKNPKLTDDEKRELLAKKTISIEVLLDELELYSYEFKSVEVSQTLELLSMYDIAMFKKSKQLYIRAINILKNLELDKATELLNKLQNSVFQEDERYKKFHKLNKSAITQTVDFFEQFKNITSYKIPSRGRELYKYIFNDVDESYNYKESQYKL